jgi:hypothetical protein
MLKSARYSKRRSNHDSKRRNRNRSEHSTKALNDLLDPREQHIGHAAKLAADLQKISFSAHTGDAKARDRLRKLNDESILHNAELESVDAQSRKPIRA